MKEEKKAELEIKRIREQRLAKTCEYTAYGDIAIVNIYRGMIVKGGKRYKIQPKSVQLIRGEIQKIELTIYSEKETRSTFHLWAYLNLAGSQLNLIPSRPNEQNEKSILKEKA